MGRHSGSGLPNPDPGICRRCAECGGVLRVTAQEEMLCSRCGRVRAWTVSLDDLTGDPRLAAVCTPAGPEVAVNCGRAGRRQGLSRDPIAYELERDRRVVYCSSFAVASLLQAMGWRLNDSGQWSRLVQKVRDVRYSPV